MINSALETDGTWWYTLSCQISTPYRVPKCDITAIHHIWMETGSKQFLAARGSVITAVANNNSARLQPTDQSLV